MNKIFSCIFTLFLFGGRLVAQLEVVPIYTSPSGNNQVKNSLRARTTALSDTLNLPFFDNFVSLKLDEKWEENRGVYINNHFAINQPSVGVATLDGVDGTGTPYFFSKDKSAAAGVGDYFDSKPIDLSSVENSDGVTLQFFWSQGTPNDNNRNPIWSRGERLRLYFKDSLGFFEQVWPNQTQVNEITAIGISDTFYLQNVLIDSMYFHDSFQFKFEYYGIMAGNYAVFNVDNIYLNKGIAQFTSTDTSFVEPLDYAISQSPSALLKDYASVPLNHFKDAPESILSDTLSVSVYSLDELFIDDKDSSLVITDETSKSLLLQGRSDVFDFDSIIKGRTTFVYWTPDKFTLKNNINAQITDDIMRIKTTLSVNTPDSIFITDSASSYTTLANYYAYDDGTIEAGLGVRGVGEFVQGYDFLKADAIEGFYVYFPKYGLDLENTFIRFNIYAELKGVGGATKDEKLLSQNGVVEYSSDSISLNKFIYIPLSTPISVSAGRYYFGISQDTENRVLLGLDYSRDKAEDIYYRLFTDPWTSFGSESGFGNVALRPVVSSQSLGLFGSSESEEINFYPNPSSGKLYFDRKVDSVDVFSIVGEHLFSQEINLDESNLSVLASGVYLLKIHFDGKYVTKKLIIK